MVHPAHPLDPTTASKYVGENEREKRRKEKEIGLGIQKKNEGHYPRRLCFHLLLLLRLLFWVSPQARPYFISIKSCADARLFSQGFFGRERFSALARVFRRINPIYGLFFLLAQPLPGQIPDERNRVF